MTTRTALLFLLGFVAVSQLFASHQRARLDGQREATSQAVTDLARVADAVRTWTATAQSGGGVARLADVELADLGLDGSPCATDVAAGSADDAACFDSPDLHIELRRDSVAAVEIVATTRDADVLAKARVRGPGRDAVAIEIVR